MQNGNLYFEYSEDAVKYLKNRDKRLGAAIDLIGPIQRRVDRNLFSSIIHHIIGQQISTRAQETIWMRLCEKLGKVDAETIDGLSEAELQSIGITYKKAGYIKDFATKVKKNEFKIEELNQLTDSEIIKELSELKGIGVWTAEMLMIFSMQRPDVVSFGDLAIHRGMRMLYHKKNIDRKEFAKYAKRYSPYGTVASLYLWAIAGGALPDMADPAAKKIVAHKESISDEKQRKVKEIEAKEIKSNASVVKQLKVRQADKDNVEVKKANKYQQDDMWRAVYESDPSYDGIFFYAVKSTGIYCRPSCKSKVPKRENICYFDTAEQAKEAGFRPCKRCRSDLFDYQPMKEIAEKVRLLLEDSYTKRSKTSQELKEIGLSKHRVGEIFKNEYGITLSEYTDRLRLEKAKDLLSCTGEDIVDIAYSVGFGGMSSFYRFFKKETGQSPAAFRKECQL
ncbi:Ada metal-binding domain-containing protein [Anaerocolumna chitinilytica]|uniref:DNA-3-methyladenine glycosylase II n=1 Tax=Anaerocolumna chitinilytica TaxID=1727145 RepID=A0A7I8DGM8_9FIRM|nr:hypothetical protein bsdcttw_07040 [Anaerocolumna chitinilytica]